jgi:hypothetical protein
VCQSHGGAAPQVQAAALRRLAELDGRRELARLGVAGPVDNPLAVLGQLAGEARQWQEQLRDQVAELGTLTAPDHLGDERARVVVLLLERAVERLGVLLLGMARASVDERLAAITEAQGRAIGDVLVSAFAVLLERLELQRDPVARGHVAEVLRQVAAQPAAAELTRIRWAGNGR